MIKVCHFTSVHAFNDQRILEKECKSLASNGFDVTLVVFNNKNLILDGVKIIGLKRKYSNRFYRLIIGSWRIFFCAYKTRSDIYHFHDPELLFHGLMLKLLGKIVIFDSHEFYTLQIREKKYIPKLFRNLFACLYSIIESFICSRLDAVIQVCTINNKNYFYKIANKTVFINNSPLLTHNLSTNNISLRERKAVVCFGSLTSDRGIEYLIQSSEFTNANFILAGNIDDAISNILNNSNFHSNIVYLGLIDRSAIFKYLNGAIAGVATLLNIGQYFNIDTLPTKAYEYMFAGIPVIMANTDYNLILNEKYQFGICVNPYDPINIAEAVNYLIENPVEAEKMGSNGRMLVMNFFNWDIEEKKLIDLYKQLITS